MDAGAVGRVVEVAGDSLDSFTGDSSLATSGAGSSIDRSLSGETVRVTSPGDLLADFRLSLDEAAGLLGGAMAVALVGCDEVTSEGWV